MPLSPADYAAPSLQNAPEAAAEPAEAAAPAAPAAKPDLKKLVAFAGDHFGVDPNVLAGMIMKESSLQDDVISGQRKSSAGAVGIAQFMPDTAKKYGVDPTDTVQSVMGMAAYLRDNLQKFDGDYAKSIAAYNWGENRAALNGPDWQKSAPAETRDYVDFVQQFASAQRDRAAQKSLPADMVPSSAGAGRGTVNPALASDAPAPTSAASRDDSDPGQEAIYDPMTGLQVGSAAAPTGNWGAAGAGRGLINPGTDPVDRQNQDLNLGSGQLWRDLKGSAGQTGGLVASSGAFAGAAEYRAMRTTMSAFDAADSGALSTDAARTQNPVVRNYLYSDADGRAAMRTDVMANMQRDVGFVHGALAAKKDYEAYAASQFGDGGILNFTDIRTATGFANWAVRTGVANSTTMAATLVAATVGGVPGLALAETVMASGDINSGRADFVDHALDPKRFGSADRQADAVALQADPLKDPVTNYLARQGAAHGRADARLHRRRHAARPGRPAGPAGGPGRRGSGRPRLRQAPAQGPRKGHGRAGRHRGPDPGGQQPRQRRLLWRARPDPERRRREADSQLGRRRCGDGPDGIGRQRGPRRPAHGAPDRGAAERRRRWRHRRRRGAGAAQGRTQPRRPAHQLHRARLGQRPGRAGADRRSPYACRGGRAGRHEGHPCRRIKCTCRPICRTHSSRRRSRRRKPGGCGTWR